MKFTTMCLCVAAAGATRTSTEHIDIMAALHAGLPQGGHHGFDILAALHGHHKKKSPGAGDPTGMLGKIMAATQQGLALAEQHHEKVIQDARAGLESTMGKETDTLQSAFNDYKKTLASALLELETTKNASSVVLEKEKNKTSAVNSWDAPQDPDQAQLRQHLALVERDLRQAQRKARSSLREATSNTKLAVEDGVGNLDRTLGDISEMVQHAQEKFAQPEDDEDSSEAPASAAFVQKPATMPENLKGADAALMAVNKKTTATLQDAKKKFEGALVAFQKVMTARADSIAKDIAAAKKVESKDINGGGVATSSFRHHHKKP